MEERMSIVQLRINNFSLSSTHHSHIAHEGCCKYRQHLVILSNVFVDLPCLLPHRMPLIYC